jgi:hypothetical protein
VKTRTVRGQVGLARTALITDALYASPSWMSRGFSSVYAVTPGLTIETAGSVPARQSARNCGKVRTRSRRAPHSDGNRAMSGRSQA